MENTITKEIAKAIKEDFYNEIEKFCFDNYRDMVAKKLAITHVERILNVLKSMEAFKPYSAIEQHEEILTELKNM